MAAGAIPPPLFLDSAAIGIFSPEHGILKNTQLETQQQITQFERPARSGRPTERSPPKDS